MSTLATLKHNFIKVMYPTYDQNKHTMSSITLNISWILLLFNEAQQTYKHKSILCILHATHKVYAQKVVYEVAENKSVLEDTDRCGRKIHSSKFLILNTFVAYIEGLVTNLKGLLEIATNPSQIMSYRLRKKE